MTLGSKEGRYTASMGYKGGAGTTGEQSEALATVPWGPAGEAHGGGDGTVTWRDEGEGGGVDCVWKRGCKRALSPVSGLGTARASGAQEAEQI